MEDFSILSSGATGHGFGEVSDSNSSSRHQCPVKSPPYDPASKFKGVVSQQNGHWGAQIYANHQRIWLGTFKSEKEAAMAYDSAAIKLRDGDSRRNFPWTNITVCEPKFQSQYSTEAVLGMIKDGSYATRFSDYLRAQIQQGQTMGTFNHRPTNGVKTRQLFQKELTPSDVSKLNRLVIPKKHAVKYFPQISDTDANDGGGVDDMELEFYDQSMRTWKFRYCYWKSSQSFVFTRGWNRFAKEKGLRPKDRVIFYARESGNGSSEVKKLFMIDVVYNGSGGSAQAELNANEAAALGLKIGQENVDGPSVDRAEEKKGKGDCAEEKGKGVWLFGIQLT